MLNARPPDALSLGMGKTLLRTPDTLVSEECGAYRKKALFWACKTPVVVVEGRRLAEDNERLCKDDPTVKGVLRAIVNYW